MSKARMRTSGCGAVTSWRRQSSGEGTEDGRAMDRLVFKKHFLDLARRMVGEDSAQTPGGTIHFAFSSLCLPLTAQPCEWLFWSCPLTLPGPGWTWPGALGLCL